MRAAALVALALLVSSADAAAQTYPKLTQPVNDFAKVVDPASLAEMDRRIRALEAGTPTHDAVVVVTVDTIAPLQSIEEYAVRLFEQAGIGQKEPDNGLLVLFAKTERQVRIEVGYGLEEFVTDGYAGDTIRQEMLPAFRRGEFGPGLLAGTTRLINRIADKRGVTLTDVPRASSNRNKDRFAGFLPFLLIIIFIIISMSRRGGPRSGARRGGWGGWGGPFIGGFGAGGGFGGGGFGGGGGGGFGGFGGGMSGGGGASGRW